MVVDILERNRTPDIKQIKTDYPELDTFSSLFRAMALSMENYSPEAIERSLSAIKHVYSLSRNMAGIKDDDVLEIVPAGENLPQEKKDRLYSNRQKHKRTWGVGGHYFPKSESSPAYFYIDEEILSYLINYFQIVISGSDPSYDRYREAKQCFKNIAHEIYHHRETVYFPTVSKKQGQRPYLSRYQEIAANLFMSKVLAQVKLEEL